MIKKKPWGTTECLIETPMMQLHHIYVLPDSFCSIHTHAGRANVFYVVSGVLTIRYWHKRKWVSVILMSDDHLSILPGVKHQFRTGSQSAEALEIYYPVLNLADIQRFTKGGRRRG